MDVNTKDKEFFRLLDNSSTLSAASKLSYTKQLRGAQRALHNASILDLFRNVKELTELDKPLATKSSYVYALVALLKRCHEQKSPLLDVIPYDARKHLAKLQKRYKKSNRRDTDKNKQTAHEQHNWITMAQWKEMDDHLRNTDRGSQIQLLVAFHVQVNPLRGGDLADVHVCHGMHGSECVVGNVLYLKENRLVVRDHKTALAFGPLTRDLPTLLIEDVRVSLERDPRVNLFVREHGIPYTNRDAYIAWKNRALSILFKRQVTTNQLRHAFVNSTDFQNTPLADLRHRAVSMGHSVERHLAYRKT